MNDLGVKVGEMVALDGPNSPEYLMMWFALDAMGASPAFINCHLTARPLMHCVQVGGVPESVLQSNILIRGTQLCDAKLLVADSDTRDLTQPLDAELQSNGVSSTQVSRYRV